MSFYSQKGLRLEGTPENAISLEFLKYVILKAIIGPLLDVVDRFSCVSFSRCDCV